MPLYEFQCKECNKVFDKIMSLREMEETLPPCPECGSKKVKQTLAAGSIKVGLGGYAGKIR